MGAGLSQTEIFAITNKIRSTLVVATILATALLLIIMLFIIEGVGVVGGVGPHSCPHLAAPRPSPASRQSAQACASRSSSWSSILPGHKQPGLLRTTLSQQTVRKTQTPPACSRSSSSRNGTCGSFFVPLAILSLCCQTNLCKRLQHKYPDPQMQTALDQRKSIRDPQ